LVQSSKDGRARGKGYFDIIKLIIFVVIKLYNYTIRATKLKANKVWSDIYLKSQLSFE
jgi:hypothetical protein